MVANIPTLTMLAASPELLGRRAHRLARRTKKKLSGKCSISVQTTGSRVGGGALPEENLETRAVVLEPLDRTVNELENELRMNQIPVIGRIEVDRYFLDLRTVGDDEIPLIADILCRVFGVRY